METIELRIPRKSTFVDWLFDRITIPRVETKGYSFCSYDNKNKTESYSVFINGNIDFCVVFDMKGNYLFSEYYTGDSKCGFRQKLSINNLKELLAFQKGLTLKK